MTDTIEVREADLPAPAPPRPMMGRRRITSPVARVTRANVADVLASALPAFAANASECSYLWDYYRGRQPILWTKRKDVRPEIDYRVVENHATEVVDFKVGYQLAEPMQYVLRNHDGSAGPLPGESGEAEGARTEHLGEINELNSLMYADGKDMADHDLFEWMCVCGIGFRICEAAPEGADAPFEQHVLDPREAFVVRGSDYRRRTLMGVWGAVSEAGERMWNCWTDAALFVVDDAGRVLSESPHTYGRVPIVEYELNGKRMGAFEPALPLLDALNAIESDRMDGIEQTVQSLLKFVNCDVDEDTFKALLELGAVKVSSPEGQRADVDFIRNDLNQQQTQVTKEDVYRAVVNICGMPNRNGTSGSSSDTGAAVLLRDGWSLAESHAKGYELKWKASEREFLKVALTICAQSSAARVDLRLRDVEMAFNRRNYENLLVKVQALTGLLPDGFHVHPEVAFRSSGLFTDPESAYLESLQWTEEHRDAPTAPAAAQGGPDDPGPQAGSPERGEDGAMAPVS